MASTALSLAGNRPFRVLWLIDSLTAGGAESLVVELTKAAHPERLRVHVCCLKSIDGNPLEVELRENRVPCTNLNARNLRDVSAIERLTHMLRGGQFDLIHAHLTYASIWGAMVSRFMGVPLVATLHLQAPKDTLLSREGGRNRLMCSLLNRWGARNIAVSEAVRRSYVERSLLDPRKLVVVHNGVSSCTSRTGVMTTRDRTLRRDLGIDGEAPVITTVSVLREGKGHDVLLRAVPDILQRHPEARFLIVGDGSLRGRLESHAAASGLTNRVSFLGFRRDVPDVMAASDLFILPSLDDALPTVLMEAMASGLPVIASNVGGIPEIVDDPGTGWLIPPGDPLTLARAATELLARPRTLAFMSARARQRWKTLFSLDAWLHRLLPLYHDVVSRSSKSSPVVEAPS